MISMILPWLVQGSLAIPTYPLYARNTTADYARNTTTDQLQGSHEPAWVAGPKSRGTLSLVFTCVITLFLSVWTTIQVNIEPPNPEIVNPTLARFIPIKALKNNKPLLKLLAKRSVRKLGWSSVALIMPEGVMAIAAYEKKIAGLLRDEVNAAIRKHPHKGQKEWDMVLAYYAIMGGFVIPEADYKSATTPLPETRLDQGSTVEAGTPETPTELVESVPKQRTDTIDSHVRDKEKAVDNGRMDNEDVDHNPPLTLTPHGVLKVMQWQSEQSKETPDKEMISITSEEIQDKSNANKLTKLIVTWQALWMIVQVVGRRAQTPNIPITLIELHTCLHAFAAFAMYVTWWKKPVDIDLPTTVHLTPEQIRFLKFNIPDNDPTDPWRGKAMVTKSSNQKISKAFLTSRSGIGKLMYQRLVGGRDIRTELFTAMQDAYHRVWDGKKAFRMESLLISFVGLVFGGVHLAAWNSSFPTYAERVLWQISSAITAATWGGFVLSFWLGGFILSKKERRFISKVYGIGLGLSIFPVLIVRLFLLVESFASIRRLPIGSYQLNTWSNIWPHVG